VEEKLKDKKVIIFKKRRRKNSQRTWGYRREICVLRVEGVDFEHAANK
jgi:ribosomal protein L21